MEDCIDKEIPINERNVRSRLRMINRFRDTCKYYIEEADKVISDLENMASGRLLLCGVGVGKLDAHLFMYNTAYEHNLPLINKD